jgi:hypothetical protein
MSTLYDRLDRCNREIRRAAAENRRAHTEAERAGLLAWEMDNRCQRESILIEIVTQQRTLWERP